MDDVSLDTVLFGMYGCCEDESDAAFFRLAPVDEYVVDDDEAVPPTFSVARRVDPDLVTW
jgi:hypothetical protein